MYQRRRYKVKLIKDLKEGKSHLCQSLLDENQFININKMFQSKKNAYKIQSQFMESIVQEKHSNPQQLQQEMLTPQQRIAEYHKQKIDNKMNQKIELISKPQVKQRTRLREPVIQKLLDSFQAKYKREKPMKYILELRESQNNLENARINTRKRLSEHSNCEVSRISRRKVISLQTGLPESPKQIYPSIADIMRDRYVDTETKKYSFNMNKFQNSLDRVFLERRNIKKQQDIKLQYQNPNQRNRQKKGSGRNSTSANYRTSYSSSSNRVDFAIMYKRSKNAAIKSFHRSENTSRKIIGTMSQFYQTKGSKKQQYNEMLDTLKHDRPVSTQLRRRNYTIIGTHNTIDKVKVYRNQAEHEREQMRKRCHDFYMQLISLLQFQNQDDIKTSIIICDALQLVLQSEYDLNQFSWKQIIGNISKDQYDNMTPHIITLTEQFIANKPTQKQDQSL